MASPKTADAVTSQKMLVQRLASSREALAGYEDALRLAQLRYKQGLSTYLDVLIPDGAGRRGRELPSPSGTRGRTPHGVDGQRRAGPAKGRQEGVTSGRPRSVAHAAETQPTRDAPSGPGGLGRRGPARAFPATHKRK